MCSVLCKHLYVIFPPSLPQVTAYTHKDDNNKWLVKKANSSRGEGESGEEGGCGREGGGRQGKVGVVGWGEGGRGRWVW